MNREDWLFILVMSIAGAVFFTGQPLWIVAAIGFTGGALYAVWKAYR